MFVTTTARMFLYVLACVIVASLVLHGLRRLTGAYEISMVVAHVLYLAILAWCVARDRVNIAQSPAPALLATVAAIALLVGLAVLGAVINSWAPLAGAVLMESMTLGYYPPGADVPFTAAAPLWSLSMLALTGAALMARAYFRRRARTDTGN